MAEGSIFKTCSCRNDLGRKLRGHCPKLHRPGGGWSPIHGRWAYQLELPPKSAGGRRQLRRSSFDLRDDAADDLSKAQALLALAAGDPTTEVQIADLLAALKRGQPLPDRDLVARRVHAGVSASKAMPLADYLWQWHRSRHIEATTLRLYAGHIRNYLVPHLGHIPIDQLRVGHIQAMFDAIAQRNIEVELARQSDDKQIRNSVKGVRVVSAATMHRIRATLRKALNDAIPRTGSSSSTPPPTSNSPRASAPRPESGPPPPSPHGRPPGHAPAPSWSGPRSRPDSSSTTPKPTTSCSIRSTR